MAGSYDLTPENGTYNPRKTPIGLARTGLIDKIHGWYTAAPGNRRIQGLSGSNVANIREVQISIAGGGGTLQPGQDPCDSPLLEVGFLVEEVDFEEIDRTDPEGGCRKSIMTLNMSCKGPGSIVGLPPYYDYLERLVNGAFAVGTSFVVEVPPNQAETRNGYGGKGYRVVNADSDTPVIPIQRVRVGIDEPLDVRQEILGDVTLEIIENNLFIPSMLRYWYVEDQPPQNQG